MGSLVNHALSLKNVTSTRCGIKLKDRRINIAGSNEYVTCQNCLVNIRWGKEKGNK